MIKRVCGIMAAMALTAALAAAQDDAVQPFVRIEKMAAQVKMLGVQGAVMGRTVKGAPYSGIEINETNQVLADGTRIHNESQTQVYRDSEGRVRRETPTDVTIFDPVANASYVLNAKTQTARKLPLGVYFFSSSSGEGKALTNFTYRVNLDGDAEAKAVAAELKAVHMAGAAAGPVNIETKVLVRHNANTEALGKRMIEGVSSDGSRVVATIEAGAIGNDRPIQTVNERWFSPELQTVMMTKHSDPRTGDESFRLTNVSRAEPPAYLFQIPAGYQIVEGK